VRVWLGETPHPIELLGGLISIAGVVLINRRHPTPNRQSDADTDTGLEVATRR
jgi:drug/metabolite transporter (DMT)-like permease